MRIRRDDGDQRQIVFMTIAELTFIFSFSAFMILSYTNEQDANKVKISCEDSSSFYFDNSSEGFEAYFEKWNECDPPKELLQGVNASLIENKALIPCDILNSLYFDILPNEQYIQIKAKLDAVIQSSCSNNTIGTGVSQKAFCSSISEVLLSQDYLNKQSRFTQISNALCPDFELTSGVPQAKYSQLELDIDAIKKEELSSLKKELDQAQENKEEFCRIATQFLEFGDVKSKDISVDDKNSVNSFCPNKFTDQEPNTKIPYCGSEEGKPFHSIVVEVLNYNKDDNATDGKIKFSCEHPDCQVKTQTKIFSTFESGMEVDLSRASKRSVADIVEKFGLNKRKECKYGIRIKSEKYAKRKPIGYGDFLDLIEHEIGRSFWSRGTSVHIY